MFPYTYLWYVRLSNYKLFIALGFVVAIVYLLYRAQSKGFLKEQILDLGIINIIAALFGSRLFHLLIENQSDIWKKPWRIFSLWEGGFVLYGGVICAVIVSYIYIKAKKLSFASVSDFFAPAIALGIGIGRMACLSWGCCYGKIHAGFFSSVFPDYMDFSSDTPKNIGLYPTQLLMIFSGIFIFALIMFLEYLDKKAKIRGFCKKLFDFPGFRATLVLVIFAFNRFMIEFLRADYRGKYVLSLSPSQWISLGLIIFFASLFIFRFRAGRVRI